MYSRWQKCVKLTPTDFPLITKEIVKMVSTKIFSISHVFLFQIYISKKWGFTKWDREDYNTMREEGRLQPDGSNVKYLPEHGPLSAWCKVQAELAGV